MASLTKAQLSDELAAIRHNNEQLRNRVAQLEAHVAELERNEFDLQQLRVALAVEQEEVAQLRGLVDSRDATIAALHMAEPAKPAERIVKRYTVGDRKFIKVEVGFNRYAHREVAA